MPNPTAELHARFRDERIALIKRHLVESGAVPAEGPISDQVISDVVSAMSAERRQFELAQADRLVALGELSKERETQAPARLIGHVTLTTHRTYPVDGDIGDLNGPTAVVPPGRYPVYTDGNRTWWEMTGLENLGGKPSTTPLGGGMFMVQGPVDEPGTETVTVRSRRYDAEEWAELLSCMQPAGELYTRLTFAPVTR